MGVELVEAPFSWNDELEAARVQTESYFGVCFNDWLYIQRLHYSGTNSRYRKNHTDVAK